MSKALSSYVFHLGLVFFWPLFSFKKKLRIIDLPTSNVKKKKRLTLLLGKDFNLLFFCAVSSLFAQRQKKREKKIEKLGDGGDITFLCTPDNIVLSLT